MPNLSWARARSRRPLSWASPAVLTSLVVIVIIVVAALLAPLLLTDRASAVDPTAARLGPSGDHPLGSDQLGRDIFARTLVGTRASLGYALGATMITTILGVTMGLLAAALGGRARQLLFQVAATATAFPAILLAVILATIFGRSGTAAMLGLALAAAPQIARITMTLAVGAAGSDQVAAAQVVGVGPARIVLRYILPQIAQPLATLTILAGAANLVALSALSFVGLGVQPPEWDWGSMLNGAMTEVYANPFAAAGPGLAIVTAGMALNIFGERLAKQLDPRHRDVAHSAPTGREDCTEAAVVPTALRPTEIQDPVLSIKELRVYTSGQNRLELVHGVDLTVGRGERVGIVGESGSGKSLTLAAAARLLPAGLVSTTQRHEFKCTELSAQNKVSERRLLGDSLAMIFQDPMSSLNPSRTIGALLSDKLRAHSNLGGAAIRQKVLDALAEVNIPNPDQYLSRYPHQLSGGQRQRVMIAMALLGDTELLLADEPTTALDVSVQRQIADLLVRVNERRGISIVLVSHDLALVSEICDRIIVMNDGRIVEQGTTEEVITNPQHPYTRHLLASIPGVHETNQYNGQPGKVRSAS
jgi:peptide/nickel transport system permease protein